MLSKLKGVVSLQYNPIAFPANSENFEGERLRLIGTLVRGMI